MMTTYKRECTLCGEPFETRTVNKWLCSPKCQQEALRQTYLKRKIFKTRRCAHCGKEFVTSNRRKITCSPECCAKRCSNLIKKSCKQKTENSAAKKTQNFNQRTKCPMCGTVSYTKNIDTNRTLYKFCGKCSVAASRANGCFDNDIFMETNRAYL